MVQRSAVGMPEAPDGISIMGCDAENGTYFQLHSDERVVLAGRNGLWYGRGRPGAFSCGGGGGRLTLAERIVVGEGRVRR